VRNTFVILSTRGSADGTVRGRSIPSADQQLENDEVDEVDDVDEGEDQWLENLKCIKIAVESFGSD
jgi:hypothetical protein